YKDGPLLDRFRQAGFSHTAVLDRTDDWNLTDPREGVETIQQRLTPEWAQRIRAKYGPVELLWVRHVLEQAQDVSMVLQGWQTLVAPDGWVLIEAPGCEAAFSRGDAGALWEEHLCYFTASSLRRALAQHGFECRWVGSYPYDVQDCLAACGRFTESSPVSLPP